MFTSAHFVGHCQPLQVFIEVMETSNQFKQETTVMSDSKGEGDSVDISDHVRVVWFRKWILKALFPASYTCPLRSVCYKLKILKMKLNFSRSLHLETLVKEICFFVALNLFWNGAQLFNINWAGQITIENRSKFKLISQKPWKKLPCKIPDELKFFFEVLTVVAVYRNRSNLYWNHTQDVVFDSRCIEVGP